MEKTIQQWFEEVEDEYTRETLINHSIKYSVINRLTRITTGFGSALNYAFTWHDTPEGHHFWYDICTNIKEHTSFKLEKPIVPEYVEFEW